MLSGKKIFKIAAPFIILAVGVFIMSTLVSSRAAPHRAAKKQTGALVRVTEVTRGTHKIEVTSSGTVQPSRSVTIIPQVSGKLKLVSNSLVPGGILPEGKVLMKVEDVDYLLNIERAKALLATGELELARVKSEARVARDTWKSTAEQSFGVGVKPNPLTVYTPQLKEARARFLSAKAALAQEKINLERTVLRAPFNSIVSTENVELGQYVKSGTAVATLTGTDSVEVVVPLRVDDLEWIDVPLAGGSRTGSRAVVSIETNGRTYSWRGSVVRSLGEVDPNGRMMRVVVEIKDPYGLKSKKQKHKPPLAIGSFVTVKIEGSVLRGVFTIARSALRDGSTAWTVEDGNKLKIVHVEPVRVEAKTVVIKDGLAEGTLVVVTDLTGAANGMKLRMAEGR